MVELSLTMVRLGPSWFSPSPTRSGEALSTVRLGQPWVELPLTLGEGGEPLLTRQPTGT